jgi:hypothetical protein
MLVLGLPALFFGVIGLFFTIWAGAQVFRMPMATLAFTLCLVSSVGSLVGHSALAVCGWQFLRGRTRLLEWFPPLILAELIFYGGVLICGGIAVTTNRVSKEITWQVGFILTGFSLQLITFFPLWGCMIRRRVVRALPAQPSPPPVA